MRTSPAGVSRLLLILAACLGGWSCARRPAHRFPIGLYDVDDPKFLGEAAENGFDCVVASPPDPEARRRFAREARRRGITLLAWNPQTGISPGEVQDWPVEAWYISDEPDVHGLSAQALEDLSRRARAWDARAQAFVLGEGAPAERLGKIADILMLDWYPIPHLRPDTVADQLDIARRFLPKGKPLWMALQAMDWKDFAQRDPARPRVGRFPEDAEMRFMSYLAVLHGARGLFYYTFKKPEGKTLLDFPEQWQALTRVSREMKAMQKVFADGRRVSLPYAPYIDSVEAAAWRWRGRDYVVVLNRKADVLQKLPEELLDRRWRPLFEVRRDPRDLLKKIEDAWYLPPYRVMVFEGGFKLGAPEVRTW